jgi:hypothetical protein
MGLFAGQEVGMSIINDNKESAARVRLWRHTIGITNRALSTSGLDPLGMGLSATEEEKAGTGVAMERSNPYPAKRGISRETWRTTAAGKS